MLIPAALMTRSSDCSHPLWPRTGPTVNRAGRRVPDQLADVRAGRFFAAATSLDGRYEHLPITANCCRSMIPDSSHLTRCCTSQAARGPMHTTRPQRSLAPPCADGRYGLSTGPDPPVAASSYPLPSLAAHQIRLGLSSRPSLQTRALRIAAICHPGEVGDRTTLHGKLISCHADDVGAAGYLQRVSLRPDDS